MSDSEEIVNSALKESGLENDFNKQHKSIMILIVEAATRRGYVNGFEDSKNNKPPKVTKEILFEWKKLFEEARAKQ